MLLLMQLDRKDIKQVLTLYDTNVWPSKWVGLSPRKLTWLHVWFPVKKAKFQIIVIFFNGTQEACLVKYSAVPL